MISLTNRKTKLPQLHDSDNRKPEHSILSHGIGVDTIQRGQKKKKGCVDPKCVLFVCFTRSVHPVAAVYFQPPKGGKKGRVQK